MTDNPTELRLALKRAGYAPIPLNGKAPAPGLVGWQTMLVTPDDVISSWSNGNTGLLTKHTPAFDIDIRWATAAMAVEAKVQRRFAHLGKFLVRTGQPPKRLIPFKTDVPFKKITRTLIAPNETDPKLREQRLEWLADGQQFVAAGIHPDINAPYTWRPPLWVPNQTVTRDELPPITEAEAEAFINECAEYLIGTYGYQPRAGLAGNGAAGNRISSAELTAPDHTVAEAVALIPNPELPEEDWAKIGLAIWGATNGSNIGGIIWDRWSAKAEKYVAAITAKRWLGFSRSPPNRIGYGTLHFLAGEAARAMDP